MRLWTYDPGFQLQQEQEILPLLQTIQSSSGAHPASYAVAMKGSYLGTKWGAHQADPHFLLVYRLRFIGVSTCLYGL